MVAAKIRMALLPMAENRECNKEPHADGSIPLAAWLALTNCFVVGTRPLRDEVHHNPQGAVNEPDNTFSALAFMNDVTRQDGGHERLLSP